MSDEKKSEDQVFAERLRQVRLDIEKIWNLFEKKMTEATFTKKEIEKEGKVVRNFMGSVESHKKVFMDAVKEFFEGK
jgi:hypothetical protein